MARRLRKAANLAHAAPRYSHTESPPRYPRTVLPLLLSAASASPFASTTDAAALGIGADTHITPEALALLDKALAGTERCAASTAGISGHVTVGTNAPYAFGWRMAPDAPGGVLDLRPDQEGPAPFYYGFAFGRMNLRGAEEVWAATSNGAPVLVAAQGDKVVLLVRFSPEGRISALEGGIIRMNHVYDAGHLASVDVAGVLSWTLHYSSVAGCQLPTAIERRDAKGTLMATYTVDSVALDPPNGKKSLAAGATSIPFRWDGGVHDLSKGAVLPPAAEPEGGVVGGLLGGMSSAPASGTPADQVTWRVRTEPQVPGWFPAGKRVTCVARFTPAGDAPTADIDVSSCTGAFADAVRTAVAGWRVKSAKTATGTVVAVFTFSGTGPKDGQPYVDAGSGTVFESVGGLWLERARPDAKCEGTSDAGRRANSMASAAGDGSTYAFLGTTLYRRPWSTGYRLPTESEAKALGLGEGMYEGSLGCRAARLVWQQR